MDAALTELAAGFAVRQLYGTQPGAGQNPGGANAAADDAEAAEGVARGDSITLTDAARSVLNGEGAASQDQESRGETPAKAGGDRGKPDDDEAEAGAPRGVDGEPLSDEEIQKVEDLEERDREVRTHEQAHQAAGGQYAGAPSYDYETGPDGKQYATSGEVKIDTGAIPNDPAATIAKMEQVKRAALAPAEPSAADRAVAAKAEQAKLKAQRELAEQQAGDASPTGSGPVQAADPQRPDLARGSLLSLTA